MTSFRRTQLLKANIARISSVSNRIRESLSVANASAPKARYAINAIAKRLILNSKFWCTGKDSNLRTSLGGTDLQSVGFNHSPTCAKPPGDAAVASSRRHLSNPRTKAAHFHFLAHQFRLSQSRLSQSRETKNRAYELQREDLCTPEQLRKEVRWKNLLRRLPESCCLPEIRFLIFVS
jgi:hypothetical protein